MGGTDRPAAIASGHAASGSCARSRGMGSMAEALARFEISRVHRIPVRRIEFGSLVVGVVEHDWNFSARCDTRSRLTARYSWRRGYDRDWSYPRTVDTLPGDFIAS